MQDAQGTAGEDGSAPDPHADVTPAPAPAPAQDEGLTPNARRRIFWPAAAVILLFVVVTLVFTDAVSDAMATLQRDVSAWFGWYYILLVAVFVVFAIWMGVSRYGDIVLGRDDDEPEFSAPVWFAMLFATGMGIGLVYWGVAEPLSLYIHPEPGVEGSDATLAKYAIAQSYLHWGIHAWAIYVVVGLALTYAIHRKGRPVSIRWALEPLLGDRVKGRTGDVIDIVAIVGTVFGVATSLGFGVLQIGAGLDYTGVAHNSTGLQMVLIAFITGIATLSVASGLGKGIKWLSNGNMGAAAILMIVVLILGPTLFLLQNFVQSIGYYLSNVLRLTFDTTAFQGEAGAQWQASWTTFYWGWWISWAPFVGVFIARISKGRTVREFVAGTLLVPTVVTLLWFAVFGGSALHRQIFSGDPIVGSDGVVDTDTALFDVVGKLPAGSVWVGMAILLVATFFVTSSDSGSLVVDMLASGGEPDPPLWSRVFWAILQGLVAAALLLAGGLSALQTAAILIALPFSIIMIGMLVATVRAFRDEHAAIVRLERDLVRERLATHVTERVAAQMDRRWNEYFGVGAAIAAPTRSRRVRGRARGVKPSDTAGEPPSDG
ncbi:BCCT family transporter [Luteimicrobium subarcticum]|uniref:Choline/glycine/proline betaine transport protein n=1 Tax=Luteimicrobium subarcticum TaxID=620910 RepID=A0A2M8WUL8_9MICO|nr:BCCT family transporter [Luteimicrobium subarcticum]PJI94645.1 choline/glycine/proline betaine transport protein [Luteimicrobium subarcticum]